MPFSINLLDGFSTIPKFSNMAKLVSVPKISGPQFVIPDTDVTFYASGSQSSYNNALIDYYEWELPDQSIHRDPTLIYHVPFDANIGDDLLLSCLASDSLGNLSDKTNKFLSVVAETFYPIIHSVVGNSNIYHKEHEYIFTIDATDPQGQDLTYEMTCNDPNVYINSDNNDHIFQVVFPDYLYDTSVVLNITVTNEDLLVALYEDTIIVYHVIWGIMVEADSSEYMKFNGVLHNDYYNRIVVYGSIENTNQEHAMMCDVSYQLQMTNLKRDRDMVVVAFNNIKIMNQSYFVGVGTYDDRGVVCAMYSSLWIRIRHDYYADATPCNCTNAVCDDTDSIVTRFSDLSAGLHKFDLNLNPLVSRNLIQTFTALFAAEIFTSSVYACGYYSTKLFIGRYDKDTLIEISERVCTGGYSGVFYNIKVLPGAVYACGYYNYMPCLFKFNNTLSVVKQVKLDISDIGSFLEIIIIKDNLFVIGNITSGIYKQGIICKLDENLTVIETKILSTDRDIELTGITYDSDTEVIFISGNVLDLTDEKHGLLLKISENISEGSFVCDVDVDELSVEMKIENRDVDLLDTSLEFVDETITHTSDNLTSAVQYAYLSSLTEEYSNCWFD